MRSLVNLYDQSGCEIILATANSDSLKSLSPSAKAISKIFYAKPLDTYAEILIKNGVTRKQEFYYGAGYLSQSARAVEISSQVKYIEVVDSRGNKRRIDF